MVTRESLGRLSLCRMTESRVFDSTVVCLMISFTSDDMTTRVKVPPTAQNGLIKISWVMTEKILAVHTSALGQRIGILEDDVMRQVEKKLAHVLAL